MKSIYFVLPFLCFFVISCAKEETKQTSQVQELDLLKQFIRTGSLPSSINPVTDYDGEIRAITKRYFNSNSTSTGSTEVIAQFSNATGRGLNSEVKYNNKLMSFNEVDQAFRAEPEIFINSKAPLSSNKMFEYISQNNNYSSFSKSVYQDMDLLVNSTNITRDQTSDIDIIDRNFDVTLNWNPTSKTGLTTLVGVCPLDGVNECKFYEVISGNSITIPKSIFTNIPGGTKYYLNVVRGYQECFNNGNKKICINNISSASTSQTTLK